MDHTHVHAAQHNTDDVVEQLLTPPLGAMAGKGRGSALRQSDPSLGVVICVLMSVVIRTRFQPSKNPRD